MTFSVYWLLHAQFYAFFGMNHWEWIPFCGSQPLSWVVTIKLHSKLTFGGQKEGVNICIFTFLMLWPQNAHFFGNYSLRSKLMVVFLTRINILWLLEPIKQHRKTNFCPKIWLKQGHFYIDDFFQSTIFRQI